MRVLLGIGIVSGCGLAEQVLLTRLLSAVLFYHFTYLVISLALLGTGAGAIAIFVWPHLFDRWPLERVLASWAALFGVFLAAAPILLARVNFSYSGEFTLNFALELGLACLIALFPFLAGGIVIALAIRAYTISVGRLYASDLAGAAIGAIASVPVLYLLSAPTAMIALGAFAGAAAALFAGRVALHRATAVLVILGSCVVAVLSGLTSVTQLAMPISNRPPEAVRWSPLNRVVAYGPTKSQNLGFLFYDKVYAPVPVYHRGQPYPNWRQLSTGSESVAFALTQPKQVLVIGGGGGRDIFDALSSRARHVDVVELNSAIVDTVDGPLAKWSGKPYTLPGVHTTVGDGRAVLAESNKKYDVINIGYTDSLSATSANALALSEQNLYTTQAFEEYLHHLQPGGILSVSRLYHLTGDEALRDSVLMLQALKDSGVPHPEQHVAVILGRDYFGGETGTVMASLTPLTPGQISTVRTLGSQRGVGVAYVQGGPFLLQWKQLAQMGPQAFCSGYQYNVCAPTDNQPFFFNMKRLDQIFKPLPAVYSYSIDPYMVLGITLLFLTLLCAVGFGLPLLAVRRRGPPPSTSLIFFAAIGLGYLSMEIVLIQFFVLFLGFPTYSLTVVLFSLLLFTGIGALISSRWRRPRRALMANLAILCGLLAAGAVWLEPWLRSMISLPFPSRVAVSVGLLAPLGLTAGAAMPIGLKRFAADHPTGVAWAWGINGIASVLGSVLAVFLAITWGYSIAAFAAAGCYLVAFAHTAASGRYSHRRSSREAQDSALPLEADPELVGQLEANT